jgi:hypothetical protein
MPTNGKKALQKAYIDEKVVALADHLYDRVTTDADPIVDELRTYLQPQLTAITQRLDQIENDLMDVQGLVNDVWRESNLQKERLDKLAEWVGRISVLAENEVVHLIDQHNGWHEPADADEVLHDVVPDDDQEHQDD